MCCRHPSWTPQTSGEKRVHFYFRHPGEVRRASYSHGGRSKLQPSRQVRGHVLYQEEPQNPSDRDAGQLHGPALSGHSVLSPVANAAACIRRPLCLLHRQNSLPNQVLGRPPSLKFDLKGSAQGRFASKSELAKKSKATLKDLDFDRVFPVTSGGLRIRPADYEKLAHRINQDARVLAELEIMDHSLVRLAAQHVFRSRIHDSATYLPPWRARRQN